MRLGLMVCAALSLLACKGDDDMPDGGRPRRDVGPDEIDGDTPPGDGGPPTVRCGIVASACCPGRLCELGLTCGRGDQCCAAPGGAPCERPADCCAGFECVARACVAPAGASCRASGD